jgi:hypothetical protein
MGSNSEKWSRRFYPSLKFLFNMEDEDEIIDYTAQYADDEVAEVAEDEVAEDEVDYTTQFADEVAEGEEEVVEEESAFIPGSLVLNHENRALQKETQEALEEEDQIVDTSENISFEEFDNVSEEELVPMLRVKYDNIKTEDGSTRFEFNEDQARLDQVQVYDNVTKEYTYLPLNTDYNRTKYSNNYGKSVDQDKVDAKHAKGGRKSYNTLIDLVNVDSQPGKDKKVVTKKEVDEEGNIVDVEKDRRFTSDSGMVNPIKVKTTNRNGEEVEVEAKGYLIEKAKKELFTGKYETLEEAVQGIVQEDEYIQGALRFQANLMGLENDESQKISNTIDAIVEDEEVVVNPFDGLLLKSIGEATGGMVDASEAQFQEQFIRSGMINDMYAKDDLIDNYYRLGLPTYAGEEQYQLAKKAFDELEFGDTPKTEYEIDQIRTLYASLASERMQSLKEDLRTWFSNDPVGLEVSSKIEEREVKKIDTEEYNISYKKAAIELGPEASTDAVADLASYNIEQAQNAKNVDILIDNAYNEGIPEEDRKKLAELGTSFQSRSEELANNRQASFIESLKEGKTKEEAEAIAKEKFPKTKEDEILENRYVSTVSNLLDNGEFDIYKDIEGNTPNVHYSEGDAAIRSESNYMKNKVDEYKFVSQDFLNRRIHSNNSELIYLAKQLNNRQAEWLFEGSSAQKFYNIVGDAVGSDQALSADIARMQEIANTGELPLKLTTIPNSESPLVKAWNNAVEDRTVLGLAKVLNVDMTSTERDGFGGAAYYSFAPAFDMENISPNEARRRMYEEMQAEGIELTDKEKFQMNEAVDSWERSGGQVGDLSRMGLEMAATFLLTGGAGNVANMSRFIMGKAFGGAVKLGMNPTVASSLTRYTAGVGAEFYALEGASLMDEQVFDKEAMGAGHNLRLAMTLGAGRAGVTKVGDKMNKAIYNTAKTQYKNGSKGLFKTLKWMNKTPGIETTTGLFKFGVAQPMTAASLLQAEGAIENIIAGKSMASIFHELTDGEALMETYGAMLAMQLSHPSQGIKKSVETFKREVDRINGDNPAWNSAYREIGLKKVKGDEYHVDADVDKAVRAKIKEIKNDPSIPTADKPNQVRHYYRLGNKLKTKKSFTELSKSWQPENVKEQVAISVYDKSYKDLDLKQKKYIDNNYKNDPLFEVGERLQSSIKSFEKGNELDGIDFLNFADAGATNGNLVPKYEIMLLGYSEKQAQGVTDLSNKVVNRARDKFSNNNKRLSSAEGMAFMNNYSQVLVMNGEIFNIQKQINEKKLTGIDKVDAEKQIEFIEKERDVIEGLNEKLSLQEYERALKEEAPRTIEMAKEAGLEVFEGNQSEINKFQEQFPEGTFVGTESGLFGVDTRVRIIDPETGSSTIPNPNKGKSIAIFNKDIAREVRETGLEAHEILGHGTQEAMVGEAAINKRASEISAEQPNISSEKAKEIATQEKLDYIDNVKSELKRRGTGAYEKVEAEMEKVKAYREYKENVKNNGARDINVEKEFLAEFVQLAEQKAFEGVKGTEREIKEVTSLELSSNPKEYVDFVLRGGTRSSKVKSEVLKESIDKLNKLNEEYGTSVSLNKSNKIAENEVRLKEHQKKRNETIGRIEKEHATSKEAWDKWTEENPGEVLKMAYSFVPDLININRRKGVENPEDTASETAMTELFNTVKAFNPEVKKTEGSFSLAGYIGKKLDWRAGDNIKRTEKKTKTLSENQEGVKTVMERQVDRSTSTPESTDKAATKGIDPRRVMDPKTVEKYNTSVKDQLLKDIVKVDKATGEKTIDLEKLDKLDYADNKIMSPKEAAEFFGISESTLAGKNPLDSKNTTKGDIKIKDGMRSEQGSEAYNLNKKLYDISEEYSRLLNTTQLQPKDIVAGDIAELEAKYKKSGSEKDRKTLQKRKEMMRAQDGQRTGDQSKQGTSLNIDKSIVKKLYDKTDIRSMGKGSQPYVQTAKNFDAKSFRDKAGIVNPKEFKGKNEAKTKKEKDALRNQSTLNTALARNYIRMVEGKIQREALQELKQEIGDKDIQQNLDKAIQELYKGSSKFSASNKVVENFAASNKFDPIIIERLGKYLNRKKVMGAPELEAAVKFATKDIAIQAELIKHYNEEYKKAAEFTDKETIKLEEERSAATEKQIIEDLREQVKIEDGVDVTFKEAKDIYNKTEKNFKDVVSALNKSGLDVEYFPSIEKNILTEEHLPKMQDAVETLLKDIDFEYLPTNIERAIQSSLTANTTLRFSDGTRANPKNITGKGATEKGYKGAGNYLEKLFEVPELAKGDKAKTEKFVEKVKYAKLPEPGAFKKSSAKINREVDYKTNPTEWMNRHYELLIGKDLLAKVKEGEMTHQEAYELTSKHNTNLKDWYFSRVDKMNPNAALVIERLQTNSSTGIPRGATSYESISKRLEKDPRKQGTKEENVESHNEHVKERLNESKEFFATYADKSLSQAQKNLNYKKMTRTGGQYLIDKRLQGDKDATGKTIRTSSSDRANTLVIPERAFDQIIMKGKDAGKTMGEVALRDMGKKRALEVLSKMKPTVETVEAKQAIEFAPEKAKVQKQNIEVAKEASMSASNKSPEKVREELNKRDKAIRLANKINKPIKKARVFDFDDTIARTKSKVFATKEGKRKVLTAEEFAKQGEKLKSEGWDMDFSDFNKVVDGKKGPLFDVMKKMKEAAGERDMFVLTARSQESAKAIHEFLKEMGLDIPIENIKGLGDSSPFAKSDWVVEKASEGYNDFYFADDHTANVKAVRDALEVIDVKSQTQIARMNASNKMNERFNEILENSTGIGKEKIFSDIKAEIRGDKARRQKFFIPPSAEDFNGLLYRTLGKGKKGEAAMEFYKENLLDPYTRAQENLSKDRVNLMSDFKELKKQLDVPKELKKKTDSGFTNEQAVRVFLWSKTGKEIPGISKTDFKELNDIVENNPKLKAFAEQILTLTKGDGYSTPSSSWNAGTITTDLISLLNKTKRAKYLEQWKENKNVIFSKENLNKLEAAFGKKYREALENSLNRMESGSNRTNGGNRLSNRVLDYVNNSTGVVMFLNARSAVLQTISAANFTNWTFNNPLKMGKAFANQPQYWKDFVELINSDYLKDRRNGLKLNISESEIADAAATGTNKAKAAVSYILEKGYAPTKFADSFAIASGGAMFYRNRVNDLVKNGMSEVDAKKKAMEEFIQASEKSQQSSDPSKISSQQASDLGRVVLSFANTPMQYARIQKRAIQDIANGRGSNRENLSKIAYYGFLQNVIFNSLQQGLFAMGFGDGDIGEEEEKKITNTISGMVDSQLRGLGMAGVTLQVLKNLGMDIYNRSERDRPEYGDAWIKLLEFSPAIKSKLSRFRGAAYPFDSKKRRAEVFEKGFSLDNPAYESVAKVISGVTNVPLDRLYNKVNNLKAAMQEDTETWKSVAMVLGWPEWQLRTEADVKQGYRDDPSKFGAWEQKSILSQFGYTDDEIKKLKNSDMRVEEIKKIQEEKDKQYFPKDEDKKIYYKAKNTDKDQALDSPAKLKSMIKATQIRHLKNYGLSSQEIKSLKYEADRVARLLELAKQPGQVDSLANDINYTDQFQ